MRQPRRRCSCRSCVRRSTIAALRRLERGDVVVAHAILEALVVDLARQPVDQRFCPPGRVACAALLLAVELAA